MVHVPRRIPAAKISHSKNLSLNIQLQKTILCTQENVLVFFKIHYLKLLNFLFYVYKPAKASQQALQAAKYLQASVG